MIFHSFCSFKSDDRNLVKIVTPFFFLFFKQVCILLLKRGRYSRSVNVLKSQTVAYLNFSSLEITQHLRSTLERHGNTH
jgi:hypothetical protein